MSLSLQERMIGHIPDLRRYARALERNNAAADDLVQETCERALKKLHLYQPHGSFLSWLHTIMRNMFIDRVRSERQSTSIDKPGRVGERFHRENQEDGLLVKELEHAVAKLRPEQRDVLLLIAVKGWSYEEASIALSVPLGTIRSRLFRARETLQQIVDPDGPQGD